MGQHRQISHGEDFNWCRHLALNEVGHNVPLLKSGWYIVTFFPRVERVKGDERVSL